MLTHVESLLVTQEELFLLPGNDLLLICFRLEGLNADALYFVLTDKLGNERARYPLSGFDRLISDYTARIDNLLSLDVRLCKQAQLYTSDMIKIWSQVTGNNKERRFQLSRFRSVD